MSRFLSYGYVPVDLIKGPGLKEFIISRIAPSFSIHKEDQISIGISYQGMEEKVCNCLV